MKFLIGKFYCCITLLFMLLPLQAASAQNNDPAVKAAYGLINRTIPGYADNFIVEIVPNTGDKDYFELESRGRQIVLRGNNGVSIASALNHYLKYYAHCDISWNGTNLNLPDPLPTVPEKIRKESPYKYRYYFNYCTFNYTASWWDWERWQKEIDFMALSGINMPLALTGQNAVWKRVYKSMGFTDGELDKFFSGPAYFSWFWMGNLDGYGGPLPNSWMKNHEELQKKILEAERGLGMKPVLHAFSG
ncbi:MAG TPA: alpha-N-acetylglucosaminidase TIM-barrel domain-containing protein, partial [Ignavibacteriales bacterium]|nr:alpha-N-acetylglucosaminidase TIM-barrel domain-containing protein [Ignavibacteriales bacterium]